MNTRTLGSDGTHSLPARPRLHGHVGWLLHQRDNVVPIPGTKRRAYLEENLAALDVTLGTDELERIDAIGPAPTGGGYDEAGMSPVGR